VPKSRCQNGDINQAPHWGPQNIACHRTKCSRQVFGRYFR